jgi:NADP-dependent 3-hydroxy acid dehydrogenase YdfG
VASRVALVTGASSGIGAATARALAHDGFEVVVAARRRDRLEELAAEIGGRAVELDVRDNASVAALPSADVVVHSAGGALGLDPVADADDGDWLAMYDVNVVGVQRVTRHLLPAMVERGHGHVVVIGSTAGRWVYEGGAGYVAAKHAVAAVVQTLRLELNGSPVRVTEIAPGMVKTAEFSLNRFGGDAQKAEKVYTGVAEPLTAEDVAECVRWTVTLPSHVNVDLVQVTPLAQASATKVHRVP